MNKRLVLSTIIISGLLAGCATAPLLTMPSKPETTMDLVSATVEYPSASQPNADQSPMSVVKLGSSVVINVPKREEGSSLAEDKVDEDGDSRGFETKDFFNAAEQEIEKVFIRNGFRVLSRAKFEAKLRDLRDEARCDYSNFNCLRSQVSPEAKPILDDLKAKFDHKEISGAEYADQIKQIKERFLTASAGKSRNGKEEEMKDISEVIRAAQSGDTRADYILQINRFDTKNEISITKDIRQIPEIREFSRQYPAIQRQLEDSQYNQLRCVVLGAELNAKLINVKTGEIVWIGNYELNEFSSGENQLKIELGERTYVTNEAEVRNFIDQQNTDEMRGERGDEPVKIPDWKFRTDLIPLTVTEGRCPKEFQPTDETQAQLARGVAKALIATIKISEEQSVNLKAADASPLSKVTQSKKAAN